MMTEATETKNFIGLRPELQKIIYLGTRVKRFTGSNDLPSGVVVDNVGAHICRLEQSAIHYSLSNSTKLTLLLHDLPEIVAVTRLGRGSDITAPEKAADPKLKAEIDKIEFDIATEIFNPYELYLFQEFNLSQECFAIFAQILDKLDASLMLHLSLARWAQSDNYDLMQIQFSRSVSHSFSHLRHLEQLIDLLPNDQTKTKGLNIINQSLVSIKTAWKPVLAKDTLLPSPIHTLLSIPLPKQHPSKTQ